jgi:hypothetical protein
MPSAAVHQQGVAFGLVAREQGQLVSRARGSCCGRQLAQVCDQLAAEVDVRATA